MFRSSSDCSCVFTIAAYEEKAKDDEDEIAYNHNEIFVSTKLIGYSRNPLVYEDGLHQIDGNHTPRRPRDHT